MKEKQRQRRNQTAQEKKTADHGTYRERENVGKQS